LDGQLRIGVPSSIAQLAVGSRPPGLESVGLVRSVRMWREIVFEYAPEPMQT
jgi:hypothetical protein